MPISAQETKLENWCGLVSVILCKVMKPEEIIQRMGIGNLWCRVKNAVKQHGKKNNIQDLTEEEAKIAEEAKQGALEILEDALKKKDKVLMKLPERIVLQREEREDFWMERHAILTEDKVKKLIAELKKVRFKKNTSRNICAAYVLLFAHGMGRTIYLCDPFWKTQKYLGKFSQPGILIHEVSHLLDAKDITYEENTFSVGCKGSLIKNSPAQSSALSDEEDWEGALRKAFLNASNIADEFEITLNHRGNYVDGRYTCCGETKRYSVCESSVPDYFHTCDADEIYGFSPFIASVYNQNEKNNIIQNEKNDIIQNEKKDIIQDLPKQEVKTSEAAKQGALEILQDALKKKDKVLMKRPERVVLKGEEKETFWMECHAILIEDDSLKAHAELKVVTFKKDIKTAIHICIYKLKS
ncbi:hypothetical protein JD844_022266 [Phrynosoma platyrhinos]|uniref:Lysine-specific metallo-endopeptidase domain-containing protein n=1 Tax=Phrynosoma platyrhinos TaxID=52577 RepID=A0ABQ7SV37_PHRPL|nr:hypothetical protein JD844_022266 [Phrynosoma platyrhinos]